MLIGQDVSPASQFLTSFVLPQVPSEQQAIIQDNFLIDIGNLQRVVAGQVSVESTLTPEGPVMADTDGDGTACSFLGGPQAAGITIGAAGGAAFVAITLYKALLLESRATPTANYITLLETVLNRTTAIGDPLIAATGNDLVLGGVPDLRAPILATLWNTCVRSSIEQGLGLPLAQVVRAGLLRVTAIDENGQRLPNARVVVDGPFLESESSCVGLIERDVNRLVCQTDGTGQAIITLYGQQSLSTIPVNLAVVSANDTLLGQAEANVVSPVTIDVIVTALPF